VACLSLAAACLALSACGGGGEEGTTSSGGPPTSGASPAAPANGAPRGPAASGASSSPSLAVGLSEANPNLVWSAAARPAPPGGFAPWRDLLVALAPRYLRLLVRWDKVAPRAGAPPDFAGRDAGCLRDVPPCAPYAGVREQLEATASEQRAQGGWGPLEVLVVPYGTPAWAAAAQRGCRPRGDEPAARAPAELATYRRFVSGLLALAAQVGARLRYWSPWNEPNHPGFLTPQRGRCDTGAPPTAPALYARMARALREALDAAPGEQEMVMGELAGLDRPRPTGASATEFIDALPRDVACLGSVWGQHAYVGSSGRGPSADYAGDADLDGSSALLTAVTRAIDAKRCPSRARLWITETAVGGPRAGKPRPADRASQAAACRDMQRALKSWYANPRVDVAFQYTFREDNFFPVGLVDTGLTRTYPVYDLWRAWGGGRAPAAPPPPLPAACRG
jgi:hypothetical protein